MFCVNCGKEIPNDSVVCGYCGTAVEKAGSGRTESHAAGETSGYNVQPNNENQRYNVQPNYGGQPGYNSQPNYAAQPGYNAYNRFKPDSKFNLWAFLFGFLWLLVHGLWDAAAVTLVINIILIAISATGVGAIVAGPIGLVVSVLIGRNANYYYRLKEQYNIMPFKALRDPNLRRI